MVQITKQSWFHIEAVFYPHKANKFRHVIDVYFDEDELEITIPENFVYIRVYSRNLNKEIAFIEKYTDKKRGEVILGLPIDKTEYPDVIMSHRSPENNLKHAKIELTYTLLADDQIERLWSQKRGVGGNNDQSKLEKAREFYIKFKDLLLRPSIFGTIYINELIHPEYYLTLPIGWRLKRPTKISDAIINSIDNNMKEIKYLFALDGKDLDLVQNNFQNEMCNYLSDISKEKYRYGETSYLFIWIYKKADWEIVVEKKLELTPPFSTIVDDKHKYNYFLDKEGVNMFTDLRNKYELDQENSKYGIAFLMFYSAELLPKITALSLLPLLFIAVNIVIMGACIFCDYTIEIPVILSYMVAYLGYIYAYISHDRDGYHMHYKPYLYFSIIMTIILFIGFIVGLYNEIST